MIETDIQFEEISAELQGKILPKGVNLPPFQYESKKFSTVEPQSPTRGSLTTLSDIQLMFHQYRDVYDGYPNVINNLFNARNNVYRPKGEIPEFGLEDWHDAGTKTLAEYLADAGVNVEALKQIPFRVVKMQPAHSPVTLRRPPEPPAG